MKVKVLVFGLLKNWMGTPETDVELPEGATVAQLLEKLNEGRQPIPLRGIAVSVNAEFAQAATVLKSGDEIGLLPPVSGGSQQADAESVKIALVRQPIDAAALLAEAKAPEDGAIVVFDGVTRCQTRGRATLYLDYEAYEEMAVKQMTLIATQAREKFGVRRVAIVHRLGKLEISESSVLIVVSSAHRGAAYEASRWLIDTLKTKVPIWKKEYFVDGAEWRDGEPFPDEIAIAPPQSS
jgi:MoaE-MoaD fusion protein